ncbi:MAK10-like protein [Tanacetum coccineum]
MPQDVPSTSDLRLIELENQVHYLMEAHLAPNQPIQVNKIASSCEICGGPHDTQYCMENPEQAFVEYASSRTDEAGDAKISRFEADFKQYQTEMTNKLYTFLKAFNDQMMGALPSDTIKNPNSTSFTLSYTTGDPQSSSNSFKSVNAIQTCFNSTTNIQKDRLQVNTLMVNEIETPTSKEPEKAIEDEFVDLHFNLLVLEVLAHVLIYDAPLDKYIVSLELGKMGDSMPFDTLADLGSYVILIPLSLFKKLKTWLLEETNDALGLADGTKLYPVGIVKNVEVHVGKLKLFKDFHVVDMEREPTCPLLVGKGFLATANAVINCKKAKIAVGEGLTRSIFGVRELDSGDDNVPYWTTIGKRESYKPRTSKDGIGAIPIDLKGNMWESGNLVKNNIDWNRPPKDRDGAWHIRIELIDPDGEKFDIAI